MRSAPWAMPVAGRHLRREEGGRVGKGLNDRKLQILVHVIHLHTWNAPIIFELCPCCRTIAAKLVHRATNKGRTREKDKIHVKLEEGIDDQGKSHLCTHELVQSGKA